MIEFTLAADSEEWKSIAKAWNDTLIWGASPDTRTEGEKYESSLKWAIIKIDGKYSTNFVSEIDNKAYEVDDYNLIKPLKEITEFEFIRWARLMDI